MHTLELRRGSNHASVGVLVWLQVLKHGDGAGGLYDIQFHLSAYFDETRGSDDEGL